KNKGKIRIAAELRSRGVDSGLVDSVLSDYEDDQSEIVGALEKYMRGKERDYKTRNKAFNYLYSRGYSSDDIREAVDRFFADGDGDEDS
ncbi:MAG: RecX family transcriptional regulator, partial [Clostridia bacterium]|nr:RecX family transcriptional regulator [Clostridia bacterium]